MLGRKSNGIGPWDKFQSSLIRYRDEIVCLVNPTIDAIPLNLEPKIVQYEIDLFLNYVIRKMGHFRLYYSKIN